MTETVEIPVEVTMFPFDGANTARTRAAPRNDGFQLH